MALIMAMTRSLLVYSPAERCIRSALQEKSAHIWDQKNRPTNRPTARWLFTISEDVLVLYTTSKNGTVVQAMKLRDEHEIVLGSLGDHYRKMNLL